MMTIERNDEYLHGKPKHSEETQTSAILSNKDHKSPDPWSTPII
jgi:hypothetical protein